METDNSIPEFFYEIEAACLLSQRYKLPQKARRANAAKMEKSARTLRETLAIGASQRSLKSRAPVLFVNLVEVELAAAIQAAMLKGLATGIHAEAAMTAALNVVSNIGNVLLAVESAAYEMAHARSSLESSLGSKDPARLQFVRAMTKSFRREFGTPLREQVAALARCIYSCDIDAATIAKLAP